jgi:hypothetical protein
MAVMKKSKLQKKQPLMQFALEFFAPSAYF